MGAVQVSACRHETGKDVDGRADAAARRDRRRRQDHQWFKSAGDAIKPGDNLFEIETDKVSMEVPSTSAGVLAEIRVAAGEVAPVGAVVAVIADGAARARRRPQNRQRATRRARHAAVTQRPPPAAAPSSCRLALHLLRRRRRRRRRRSSSTRSSRCARPSAITVPRGCPAAPRVTPLARRLAAQGGIDLAGISPSGPHGRILARDVETALASGKRAAPAVAGPASADQIKALYRDVPFEEVPLDGMRRTIATRLVQATQTIPHFYLTADVEIGALIKLREQANAAAPKDARRQSRLQALGQRFRHQGLGGGAAARARRQRGMGGRPHPALHGSSDIGVAVAVEGGLITPVIRSAETKTLSAISQRDEGTLGARAREEAQARRIPGRRHRRSPISACTACANSPPSSIRRSRRSWRWAPRGGRRSRPRTAASRFASVMSVTLSCDHRVVDGALGAELLAAFKGCVEQPVTMLV